MGNGEKHDKDKKHKDGLLEFGVEDFPPRFPYAEFPADCQKKQQPTGENGQLASGKHGTQVFSGFLNIGGQNGKKRDIVKKAAVFHKISNINQRTELQEECEKKSGPLLDPQQQPVFLLIGQQKFHHQQKQEEHDAAAVIPDIQSGIHGDVVRIVDQMEKNPAVSSQPAEYGQQGRPCFGTEFFQRENAGKEINQAKNHGQGFTKGQIILESNRHLSGYTEYR